MPNIDVYSVPCLTDSYRSNVNFYPTVVDGGHSYESKHLHRLLVEEESAELRGAMGYILIASIDAARFPREVGEPIELARKAIEELTRIPVKVREPNLGNLALSPEDYESDFFKKSRAIFSADAIVNRSHNMNSQLVGRTMRTKRFIGEPIPDHVRGRSQIPYLQRQIGADEEVEVLSHNLNNNTVTVKLGLKEVETSVENLE